MTDKRITELTPITGANLADDDEFVVVDISADETKSITYGELKTFSDLNLDTLGLNAIAESKGVTAVDVFVYDTSKDSDGGAWRKRMQNRSWYDTNGDFPSATVILATASSVIFYSADDPLLPVWTTEDYTGLTITSVSALNGKIVIGTTTGVVVSDYALDDLGSTTLDYTTSTSPAIVNNSVNDVAMTVLSGAPIDAATGLAVPTIAVATDGGVSVINNDSTVADSTQTVGMLKVWFGDNDRLFYSDDASDQVYYADTYAADGFNAGGAHYDADTAPYTLATNVVDIAGNTFAHTSGITILDEDQSTQANGMVAYITDTYNTGWMQGDIKGAFLSSTDTATLVGSNLVANGTFDTDTVWTKTNGATISSGVATLPATGSVRQSFTTVVGKTYAVQAEVTLAAPRGVIRVGTISGGLDLYNSPAYITTTGNKTVFFTATTTTSHLTLFNDAGSSGDISWDNVVVSVADEDRSVNANPLIVNGTITRTPVATGAELVAYSGFSASNYLEQPYNSDLDFGTGDFCIMGWVKLASTGFGGITHLSSEKTATTNNGFGLFYNPSNLLGYISGVSLAVSGPRPPTGAWQHCCFLRQSGVVYLYQDGVLTSSVANTKSASPTDTTANLLVGGYYQGSVVAQPLDNFALLRISATAPTAGQIKKIYEDEKFLFQENANAVLTNSTVPSLAFDTDTNLLHVGGNVGRDEFQGLRRTSTTAGAVTSAISAQNNLVATGKASTVDVSQPAISLRELLNVLRSNV